MSWEDDILLFPVHNDRTDFKLEAFVGGAYKTVDKKVKPVAGVFPESAKVRRSIPEDPLRTLKPLPTHPPEFIPTKKVTLERMEALQVNKDNFLQSEEEKLFKYILCENEDALAFEEQDRGTLRKDYFSDYIMPTVPHTPWEFKNIPIPPGIRDTVIEMLKSKIDAGVYEPCQSSYRGRWFCVLKKNGSLRIVHDLQPLNGVSIRDAGLLPIVDDFVEPFAGRQCLTTFDLYWGFDARIVDPASRDMTAFWTPLGQLRLTALPMGYTNSPAEFQKCMVFILQDEIPHIANIFIDDLPIKGPVSQYLDEQGKPETIPDNPGIRRFIWEHANDVHRIMHRVKCAGATFSGKKTEICRREAVVVGQKCSPEGRSPDDTRVTKILEWPVLTNTKEVRGFLGLCGTVRIWIKDYSRLARPLTELVHKDADFVWDEETTCQPKLELYGLYRAVRHWRLYLIGAKNLVIEVDAKYIKGMLKEPDLQPNNAMNRWIQGILMFDFTLRHVPGTQFKGPDALSRKAHKPEEYIEEDDEWLDDIALWVSKNNQAAYMPKDIEGAMQVFITLSDKQAQSEQALEELRRFMENPEELVLSPKRREQLRIKARKFICREGTLFRRKTKQTPVAVVLDNSKRLSILKKAHDDLGHKGVDAVFGLLRQRFYWPHMRAFIQRFVASCHECQIRNTKQLQMPYEISAPVRIFQKVYIDVMVMRPKSGGYSYIVAAKDDLTGVSEAVPLVRNSSKSLASFFWDYIYCRYGAPEQIVTDNGSETKKAFSEITTRLGIPHVRISPYNKHANGVVERGHFTLREAIVKSCKKREDGTPINWHNMVSLAVFADRITVSSVTGYSPYFLLHGTHPVIPLDYVEASLMVTGFYPGMPTAELLALRMRQLERRDEDLQQAAETLRKARCSSKEQYMRRYHHRIQRDQYDPGALVLVRNSRLEDSVSQLKTAPRYIGPYQVVKRTRKGNYILREMDGTLLHEAVAAFRVIGYLSRDDLNLEEVLLEPPLRHEPMLREEGSDGSEDTSDSPLWA
ncbi:hypothetical protein ONZ45_g13828 [Pleurotus djamor]|nr:hypothetical protein ONZ45_g13828 [Pleurotus djamor]